jgi:hypothetical protein
MDELGLFTEWLWAVTAIVQALLLCLLLPRRLSGQRLHRYDSRTERSIVRGY